MNKVLLINASPQGEASHAYRLALELVAASGSRSTAPALIERDLGRQPLPPLTADYARALTTATPFEAPVFALSETLIHELEASDVLLIATPMHNFTVPAALKLWIDYVLRIHRTFSAGPEGKVGLLRDRPSYVLVGSGGFHQGARARQPDFLTSYMRHALNTLGIFDLHFSYLQGLVSGDGAVDDALAQARARLALEPLFGNFTDY